MGKNLNNEHCKPLNFQHRELVGRVHTAALTKHARSSDNGELQTADDQTPNSSEMVNFALFVFLHHSKFYEEKVICIL